MELYKCLAMRYVFFLNLFNRNLINLKFIKYYFCKNNNKSELNTQEAMISGFFAGAVSGSLTNPIDVVNANLMANKDIYFKSYSKCIHASYNESGILAFMRGIHLRTFHIGLLCSVFYGGYEQILNHVSRHLDR